MERVDSKSTARCITHIEASPQELRMVADRLDAAERNCLPGQEIVVPFTATTTILYKPQVKSAAATGLLTAADLAKVSETQLPTEMSGTA